MKNFIFCAAGVALGFFVGFLVANTMSQPSAATQGARAARQAQGPDGLTRDSGELPPNHPDISGLGANASPGANSAAAQPAADAADKSPRDFAAQMSAAEAFYNLRDYPKAEVYAARAIDINPEDTTALVLMGNSKYDRGDYAGAADFYKRALDKDPNDPNVRTDYGNTFFLRDPPDYDRAIAEYRKSIEVDPRHEQSWLNLASASIQKRDKAAALEALARLESINPQNTSIPTLRQSAQAIQ